MKVLFVDDDQTTLFLGKREFDKTGIVSVLDTAENGKQALELINNNEYDAIFTDINMPEMDGWELMEHCKGKNLNFICFVPYGELESIEKAKKLNAINTEKPIKAEKIIEILKSL